MMTSKRLLPCLAALLLASPIASADTIAEWTFETSLPAGTPGAGVWITNIAAEVGSGTAAGLHAGNATYSTPVGNGSAHSFSSTAWAVGDFYQFAVSTLGFQNVTVAYDQAGSATGPRDFLFSFSTDGISFTPVGSSYIVLTNSASANNEGSGKSTSVWSSSGSQQSVYTFSFDLSSTNSLADQPVVYFRLTVADGTAENGASIGSGGTDRVDNFLVFGAPLVSVTQPWLNIQLAGTNVVLTWTNALFNLQSAPEAAGIYTNIPAVVSPYTNSAGDPQKFYRLAH
ncbi:MAG: hypothetical protein ACLP2Y_17600 [Limisphaerales bacterium]